MKIFGLCIVRNEADVIAQSLEASADWCDEVFVYDNGSTDGTWEVVKELAVRHPHVVAWKTESKLFSDGLRAEIFHRFKHRAAPGDWWCRLDADEFYIDDPRVFLRKVPAAYDVVWSASFRYCFTDRDAAAFWEDPDRYADEVPVSAKIRYYVNDWSEPRFFRHRAGIRWDPPVGGFPAFVVTSPGYPVRIWLKHYQYRSPQQIQRRLTARNEAVARGRFLNEAVTDFRALYGDVRRTGLMAAYAAASPAARTQRWEDRIAPATGLDFDHGDRRFVVNEQIMPPIPSRHRRLARGKLEVMARLRTIKYRWFPG